jgi:hypothetical protein
MKAVVIVVTVVLLLVVLFQIATAVTTGRTERQRYRLVKRIGEVEIRFYPEAVMATVVSPDGTYRGSANRNFGRLAGYIFGGNKKAEKIAMTAPVHMELGINGSSMSFVMPARHNAEDLPQPNDDGVTLHSVPSEYVAVVRFGGFASDDVIQAKRDTLAKLLAAKGIPHKGNFRFLGYNPPFQWVARRNEVIVGVEWKP